VLVERFLGDDCRFIGDVWRFTGDGVRFAGADVRFTGDDVRFTGDTARFFLGDGARSAMAKSSLNTRRNAMSPLIGSGFFIAYSNFSANSRARSLVLELWWVILLAAAQYKS
jgi:hypothetical protein